MGTFDLALLGLVDVLLVVGDHSLREGLTDGVDLGDIASTSHSDPDVEALESLEAEEENGLEDLHSQGLGLEEFDG